MVDSIGAQILDCTLRDGSYVVDFQLTREDTFIITKGLVDAGIRRIEVGHGLGLNAGNVKGRAAETDGDYIRAASKAAGGVAKVGSFFIPGIGDKEHIHAAREAGLDFIRLGIDVDDYKKLEPFIDLSRSLGLEVWANMMKSYIVTPSEFGRIASRLAEMGADVVSIVDSAGGMVPDEVLAYTSESLSKTSIPLGFHGHDNLTLAVANCLQFVQAGGRYVDGSLAGIGRSGGNAATELLAALLVRNGKLEHQVDSEALIEFADAVLQYCVPGRSCPRAIETATGLGFFHSSFGGLIEQAIKKTGASYFRTLLELPAGARKTVRPDVALQAAHTAKQKRSSFPILTSNSSERVERSQPSSLKELSERLRVDRGKFSLPRVVTVAFGGGKNSEFKIGPLRKGSSCILAHIEIAHPSMFARIRKELEDVCEFWFLDKRVLASLPLGERDEMYSYDDDRVIEQALMDALQFFKVGSAFFVGQHKSTFEAVSELAGICISTEAPDALVACSRNCAAQISDVGRVREGGIIFLLEAGALSKVAISEARCRGLTIWRVDCGPSLLSEIERMLHTLHRFNGLFERISLPCGANVVACGLVGEVGDIVVDNCQRPRFIIGECDGLGGVVPLRDAKAIEIQGWITECWSACS